MTNETLIFLMVTSNQVVKTDILRDRMARVISCGESVTGARQASPGLAGRGDYSSRNDSREALYSLRHSVYWRRREPSFQPSPGKLMRTLACALCEVGAQDETFEDRSAGTALRSRKDRQDLGMLTEFATIS